jgi:adenylate cyclase
MATKIEIERRFLVKLPLKWYARPFLAFVDRKKIYQTYLKEERYIVSRIRCEILYKFGEELATTSFTYTRKNAVFPGMCEEDEIVLTPERYGAKAKVIDPTRNRIEKIRYMLPFYGRMFELDVFEGKLSGLSILEIELDSLDEKVYLPPYIKILKEITTDRWYSNYNLSTLKKYSEDST